MAWLKAHKLQLLVVVLSALVAAGLHWKVITPDQAIGFGTLLAALGIHLPAVIYKVPPVVGSMLTAFGVFLVGVFMLSLAMLACSAAPSQPKVTPDQVVCLVDRQVAIVECVRANNDKASIDACLAREEGKHCTADALVDAAAKDAGGDS